MLPNFEVHHYGIELNPQTTNTSTWFQRVEIRLSTTVTSRNFDLKFASFFLIKDLTTPQKPFPARSE